MGRRQRMTAAQQAELGNAVVKARGEGVPWKALVNVYGRSRAQLDRYARGRGRNETSLSRNETSSLLRRGVGMAQS